MCFCVIANTVPVVTVVLVNAFSDRAEADDKCIILEK